MSAHLETERSLIRVVKIDDVITHPNADKLDIAFIGGWQCVVKRDSVVAGELAIYAEIDSLLPLINPIFSFLGERKSNIKVYNDIAYSRIKTIRLRGEISQGLLLPIKDIPNSTELKIDDDLTELLGVLKYVNFNDNQYTIYEPEQTGLWGNICSFIRGNPKPIMELEWPDFLAKSKETRAQNSMFAISRAIENKEEFEVSVKLNGSSVTIFHLFRDYTNDTTGVCSRNHELRTEKITYSFIQSLRYYISDFLLKIPRSIRKKDLLLPKWETEFNLMTNHFVNFYLTSGIADSLKQYCIHNKVSLAIQGELCGPNIQSNYEELTSVNFFVYALYEIEDNTRALAYTPDKATPIIEEIIGTDDKVKRVHYIPVIAERTTLPNTMKEILDSANGKLSLSDNKKKEREGVVYKSLTSNFSFKVISNKFLLKEED